MIQYVPYLARLIFWEQLYLDYYLAANHSYGFNICSKAGSTLGREHTLETRAKISEATKGNQSAKGYKHTPEYCAKKSEFMREAMKGNKNSLGFKHTAETRAKVSLACKGRTPSAETRVKISAIKVKNNPFYWVATSPDGVIYDPILNLSEFCRDHNLHHGVMCDVANGKRNHYKGWLCQKVEKVFLIMDR